MTDKHTLVERLENPGWSNCNCHLTMEEAATRITALEAEKAELVGVLERIDAEVGPENDWTEKLAELHTWAASAFLAGERAKDVEWHKAQLRSFLCGMIGYLHAAGEGAAIARAKLAKARQSDEGE